MKTFVFTLFYFFSVCVFGSFEKLIELTESDLGKKVLFPNIKNVNCVGNISKRKI